MTVKEETVSPPGITLVIENSSDKECTYGEEFRLEKKTDGKWQPVPLVNGHIIFFSVGYRLFPGATAERDVRRDGSYGTLDAGEYRIIKEISVDNTECELAAKFKIPSDDGE